MALDPVIGLVTNWKKFLLRDEVVNDGPIFWIHNTVATAVLFSCSLVVTITVFVGEPIQCLLSGDSLPIKPINTFCWIHSTYLLTNTLNENNVEAYAGLGNDNAPGAVKKFYPYYQWVCFVLFFQGCLCYVPKLFWEQNEAGLMKTLVKGLNNYIYTEEEKKLKKETIVNYMLRDIKKHKFYAVKYWISEFLCLVNIVFQIYWIDRFFGGEFLRYGLQVFELIDRPQDDRVDPMSYLFPMITKCTFEKFGASGSIVPHDAMCLLPLNVINQKIYVILWFMFLALLVMFIALLVYRLCLILIPWMRPALLRFTRNINSRYDAQTVTSNLSACDWWILYMLGGNLNGNVFNEIVADLAHKLQHPLTKCS